MMLALQPPGRPRPTRHKAPSRSATSTATRPWPPTWVPYRNGWSSPSKKSTRPADCWAGSWRSRATMPVNRTMQSGMPTSSSAVRRSTCSPAHSCRTWGSRSAISRCSEKKLFVASEPLTDTLVWEKGNRYTFRLRPSTYLQAAMLVEEAAKLRPSAGPCRAQLRIRTIGRLELQGAAESAPPDVEFIAEHGRRWENWRPARGAGARSGQAASDLQCPFGADLTSSCAKAICAACSKGARS